MMLFQLGGETNGAVNAIKRRLKYSKNFRFPHSESNREEEDVMSKSCPKLYNLFSHPEPQ